MYSMPKMRSAKSTAGSCVGLYLVYIVIHCPERFPLNRSRKRMDGEKFKMTKMASGHVTHRRLVIESRPAVRLHAGLATRHPAPAELFRKISGSSNSSTSCVALQDTAALPGLRPPQYF